MKFVYIFITFVLLSCCSGIASAGNTSTNYGADKIVDLDKIVESAGDVWGDVNSDGGKGNYIMGLVFLGCLLIILYAHFKGYAMGSLGNKVHDSNFAKEGKEDQAAAVKATAGLVIGFLVILIFLALL